MKEIIHCILGHKFLYGDFVGIQRQPTKRACWQCGRVEEFRGELTPLRRYWFMQESWKTKEEWEELHLAELEDQKTFQKLTGTPPNNGD